MFDAWCAQSGLLQLNGPDEVTISTGSALDELLFPRGYGPSTLLTGLEAHNKEAVEHFPGQIFRRRHVFPELATGDHFSLCPPLPCDVIGRAPPKQVLNSSASPSGDRSARDTAAASA